MNLSEKPGEIIFNTSLPLWVVLIPLICAFLILGLGGRRERFRQGLLILGTVLPFGLTLLMFPAILSKGGVIKFGFSQIIMGMDFEFLVDPLALFFTTLVSFVWFIATLYSLESMKQESKPLRFYFFFLLALSANLGVFLAGDLFSLFLFFEGLGLLAYPLIIHRETKEAFVAGAKYLVLAVLGGLTLLLGIFLLYFYSGSLALAPSLQNLENLGYLKYLISALLIVGFGVKADMIPFHIWLRQAYPETPSPATAILSSAMMKAGAYGIIRVVGNIFRPDFGSNLGEIAESLWQTTSSLGYTLIWLGITSMLLGALMALFQENGKRLLAYSSISQIGYILVGIGAGAYLAEEGALGFAGGIYHILNHSLFKAALLLSIGAVYFRTRELNISKLGGLWRKMPLVFIATLIAAGGIVGLPLFNGFASKSLLHEALIESYKLNHLFSLKLAEIIFTIASGITFAYISKLVYFTFLGKRKKSHKELKEVPGLMNLSLLILAGIIILVGFFPNLLIKDFLAPITESLRLPLEGLTKINFFTFEKIEGALPSWIIGLIIFAFGIKYGFALSFPDWLSIDYWYLKLAKIPPYLAERLSRLNDTLEEKLSQLAIGIFSVTQPWAKVGSYLDRTVFSLMVDMWLPQPITIEVLEKFHPSPHPSSPSTTGEKVGESLHGVDANIIDKSLSTMGKSGEKAAEKLHDFDEKVVDRLVNGVGTMGLKMSHLARILDYRVVDMVVIGMAFIAMKLSQVSGAFDKWVIDGIVNWIAQSTKGTGRALRPTQTGQVQEYGLAIMLGAAFLLIIVAIFVYFSH